MLVSLVTPVGLSFNSIFSDLAAYSLFVGGLTSGPWKMTSNCPDNNRLVVEYMIHDICIMYLSIR